MREPEIEGDRPRSVGHLRDRARSIDADIRRMLDELLGGERPEQVPPRRPASEHWQTEAQRIKRDIDQIVRAYEAASAPRTPPPTPPEPMIIDNDAEKVASLKKVLMLVVTELV